MASESDILDFLRRRGVPRGSGLTLGIGDDCAVYHPKPGEELVFTTDFLIEDVHFRWQTHTAAQVGHNALARGLSDVAAMGANPRFCLLSLALPRYAGVRWVKRFYSGLFELADETGTALAGGDLARAPGFCADIVVCGSLPAGSALRRSGARAGDRVYVSGSLGGSAAGLAQGRGALWKRHVRIEPRLRLGEFLRKRGEATACMDLSDGLSLDLNRLCRESAVSANITLPPVYPGATEAQALHGGEDYELLFTAPPQVEVPEQFEGLPLTAIGKITAGGAGRVLLNGRLLKLGGFDHFAPGLSKKREASVRARKRPIR